MSLESLIKDYGYYAVLCGTFFEGETILIIGGFAAHQGYLELPQVILCAAVGSIAGDQLFFFIGRLRGIRFLNNRPHWRLRTEKARQLLERHQVAIVLGFRFMYGLRTVIPFTIGMSKVRTGLFVVLNVVSAAAWAFALGTAGYLFGAALQTMVGEIKKYELLAMSIMALVGGCIWLSHLLDGKRLARTQKWDRWIGGAERASGIEREDFDE